MLIAQLDELQNEYAVVFNYSSKELKSIPAVELPDDATLDETLNILRQKTGFEFVKIDYQYIAIRPSDRSTICGTILSGLDSTALVNATITAGKQYAISDTSGRFSISIPKTAGQVEIRYIGYRTQQIETNQLISCPVILMQPSDVQLQEIIMKNVITQGITKRIDGAFELKTTEMNITPGLTEPDVLHTIQLLPGINSINETVSDINVRGGTNDQNLVLWNGTRMYQSGHFFGLISAFNPYITPDVSLIKNGSSAAYGEGASSTIDMRSSGEVSEKVDGAFGVNMLHADLLLSVPISPKISVDITGRRSITDWVQTNTYNRYFERIFENTDVGAQAVELSDSVGGQEPNFLFYDGAAKLNYEITPSDKLELHFIGIHNELDYTESGFLENRFTTKSSSLVQNSLASGVKYRRNWNEGMHTAAEFHVSSYDLRALNNDVPTGQTLLQQNEVLDTEVKLNMEWQNGNNRYETGYQFREVGMSNLEDINTPAFRRLIKEVVRNHAVYADAYINTDQSRLYIWPGLRVNYFQKWNRVRVEPRLALDWQFAANWRLETLAEMKHQTSTQVIDFQNDFLGVENRRWVLANNSTIPLITSQQASIGLIFEKRGFIWSTEAFTKQVDGIITSSQGFQNQFQSVRESGDYTVSGLNTFIQRSWNDINLWLSYDYAVNRYNFPDLVPSEFDHNLDIRHMLSAGTIYRYKALEVSSGIQWRTGRPFTPLDATNPVLRNELNFSKPNSDRLNEYLRWDASVRYTFSLDQIRIQLGAGVWNITDQNNIINRYFIQSSTDQAQQIDQPALSRTFQLMFRLLF